jgi:hypothetical protein
MYQPTYVDAQLRDPTFGKETAAEKCNVTCTMPEYRESGQKAGGIVIVIGNGTTHR